MRASIVQNAGSDYELLELKKTGSKGVHGEVSGTSSEHGLKFKAKVLFKNDATVYGPEESFRVHGFGDGFGINMIRAEMFGTGEFKSGETKEFESGAILNDFVKGWGVRTIQKNIP